ncbi:uncharacterized protein LOC142163057 [Nicotiana tabacum]|uniref:Uncharacterized protein LOC142163057 n=1 Tax=Nicotiana tabacum TaxID=4097 RepID=A0AC58RUJ9_TOBAC
MLFDPGSTYSYVSSMFAHFLCVPRKSLGTPIYVFTLAGDFIVVHWIYWSCIVTFCGHETREDLLLLDLIDVEVIMGMDLLSPYYAILDCHAKTITLVIPKLSRLEWKGLSINASSGVISFLKARHMVEKGCLDYIAYVRDTFVETPTIDSLLVVREFSDVFPSDLPGMSPDHDIDLYIDLALGAQPITILPYCMAPKELKEQLEELLAKGFIRPSVSPWGGPMFFMKKKYGTMHMCIYYLQLTKLPLRTITRCCVLIICLTSCRVPGCCLRSTLDIIS